MTAAGLRPGNHWWRPVWSRPAALRAVRAAVVLPALFALTQAVIGDPQMTLFATFGGFATLVIANFGGSRRVKLVSHAGLAIAGSVVVIVGTAASGATWLAALVTVPVVFAVFFAGSAGPNAAAGVTPVLFAYVLPIASAGGAGTIPSRLAGWWLASAVGTAAVLLFSPGTQGDRLRAAAAALAGELAIRARAASGGLVTPPADMRRKAESLRAAFTAAPYRPTGLATADQALASVVQLLDWAATQAGDAFDTHAGMSGACAADRTLLAVAADVFGDVAALLEGREADPDFGALEKARAASAAGLRDLPAEADTPLAAAYAVHAQAISVAARTAAADALIAAGRADPATIARQRRTWFGLPNGSSRLPSAQLSAPRLAALTGVTLALGRDANIRSVWFANSLRGAVALAAAVAVADLSGVQHGFWVVLGTLSVLRTNAAATGATAWRALAGTVAGFAVGGLLLAGIGTGQAALWAAFPLAVLVAAYTPGTAPFMVGQAAFTVTIVVLFNILVPAGWRVGLLRVEDVALGCAVSLVVGVLAWPRGASGIVARDLADAFRTGSRYLRQAVDWALSELMTPPAAAAAAFAAGLRLDDAVRGYLAEEGSKRVGKDDLWALLAAAARLRLTANTLSGLRHAELAGPGGPACLPLPGSSQYAGSPACAALRSVADGLAEFYEKAADEVERPAAAPSGLPPVPKPPRPSDHAHLLWIAEHLHHLARSAQTVAEPAQRLAEIRRRPWWR